MSVVIERIKKGSNILSVIIFILSSVNFFDQEKVFFASFLLGVGLLNLASLRVRKEKIQVVAIISLNFLAALITTYDFILSNSKYLHFAWTVISFMYFVAIVITILKYKGIARGAKG